MIRPFKIYSSEYHSRRIYTVYNHRNEKIGDKLKLPEDFFTKLFSHPITAFGYEDISSLINKHNINPKFSKHDVIKALDFWIEHWVYSNQVDYAIEGTVNVDFEITLKELILVREKVMKMPVKTKFTRFNIRDEKPDLSKGAHNFNYVQPNPDGLSKFYHYDGDNDRVITNMTHFEILKAEDSTHKKFPKKGHYKKPKIDRWYESEAIIGDGGGSSVLDPFCYVVKTQKQVKKNLNNIGNNATSAARIINQIFTRMSNSGNDALDQLTREMAERVMQQVPRNARISDRMINNTTTPPGGDWTTIDRVNRADPHTWRVVPHMVGTITDSWKVIDDGLRNVAIDFRTEEEAQGFINHNITQNSMVNRDRVRDDIMDAIMFTSTGIDPSGGLTFGVTDSNGHIRTFNGAVTSTVDLDIPEDISVNVTVNRNIGHDANGNPVHIGSPSVGGIIRMNGMDFQVSNTIFHTLTEPEHPSLPEFQVMSVPVEARSITVQDEDEESDEIVYENMLVGVHDFGYSVDSNSFVMVPVEFVSGGTRIHTNVFFESDDSLAFARSMNTHNIRISPRLDRQSQIFQIDDKWYYVVDINISHDPRNSMKGFVFKNLYVESSEATAGGRQNTLRIDFGGVEGLIRYKVSVTLLDPPSGGRLMSTPIDQEHSAGPWNVEILGDERVRIGEDIFRTVMPIDINMH